MELLVTLGEWLHANPEWSGLVFVIVFAAVMAVGIPGGNVLMLSGGLLFGRVPGAILATAGAGLAALATYGLIRTAFGRWLDERARHAHVSVRSFVESGNAALLVLPRLIPLIPFFVLNVGLTAAGVPVRTYLWTTVVGVAPVALLFASIGSELRGLEEITQTGAAALLCSPGLLVPLILLIGLTVLGWLWVRRRS